MVRLLGRTGKKLGLPNATALGYFAMFTCLCLKNWLKNLQICVFSCFFPPWRKSGNWVVLHFPRKPFWTIELESHGVRFNRKWCAVQLVSQVGWGQNNHTTLVHNSVELVPDLRFVQPRAEKIRVRLLQHVCAVCTIPYVCCESPHFFFNLLSRFLPWISYSFHQHQQPIYDVVSQSPLYPNLKITWNQAWLRHSVATRGHYHLSRYVPMISHYIMIIIPYY